MPILRLVHEQATDSIAQVGGLTIRPMQPGDVDVLVEWFADPEIWRRWWGHEDDPYERDEIAGWFQLRDYEPDRFLIVEEFDTAVGYAQWHALDATHLTAMVAGFVKAGSRCRGIGPQALRALAEYLVDRRGFLRVEAGPEKTNDRTNRACEKAGFRFDAAAPVGAWAGAWTYPPETRPR